MRGCARFGLCDVSSVGRAGPGTVDVYVGEQLEVSHDTGTPSWLGTHYARAFSDGAVTSAMPGVMHELGSKQSIRVGKGDFNVTSTEFSDEMCQGKGPLFENPTRDDLSSKNESKRVRTDRDTSLKR